jgi:hypothetical protein
MLPIPPLGEDHDCNTGLPGAPRPDRFCSSRLQGKGRPRRALAIWRELAEALHGSVASMTCQPQQPHLMPSSVSRELQLAAACAMWPHSERRTEAILAATARPLDWERFLRVVVRQRVVGLVHDGLTRTPLDVPAHIALELRTKAETLVHENLAMACEALRLQRLFDEANLPILFVKGASLAVLAYSNLGLRQSQDIDVLVAPEALPQALEIIAGAGYRRYAPPPNISEQQLRQIMPLRKDMGFIHGKSGMQLELHWRLFLNAHAMEPISLIATSRVVAITESTGLRTLEEEDLFTYLCLHGALHSWSQLKWLADIGALLAAAPKGGAARLINATEARGAEISAAQAMLLCQKLLGTSLPSPILAELNKQPKMRWLQKTALKAMTAGHEEREPREVAFGTTRGSLTALVLRESWRYRLAELRNILTNESDILKVPLPERLQFLYPILRLPLWIRRQMSRRIAK